MTALFNLFKGHLEQLFGYIDIRDLGLPSRTPTCRSDPILRAKYLVQIMT